MAVLTELPTVKILPLLPSLYSTPKWIVFGLPSTDEQWRSTRVLLTIREIPDQPFEILLPLNPPTTSHDTIFVESNADHLRRGEPSFKNQIWAILLLICRTYQVSADRITSPHADNENLLAQLRSHIDRQAPLGSTTPQPELTLNLLGRSLIEVQASGISRFIDSVSGCPVLAVQFRLFDSKDHRVVWHSRAFERNETFQSTIPAHQMEGVYRFIVEAEEENRLTSVFSLGLELPLKASCRITSPPFRADIFASVDPARHAFLKTVRGVILNSGHLPWMATDPAEPFRLGYVMRSGERVCAEHRIDLPSEGVAPGEIAAFQFSFNTLEFPDGQYTLYLDAVKERRFWFSKLGSAGAFLPVEIRHHGSKVGPKNDRLINPPFVERRSLSICYITPTLPLFDQSSGGRRLIDLFRILRENDVEVTLLYQQTGVTGTPQPYLDKLHSLGVEVAQDPLEFLDLHAERSFNVCVLGWYQLAAELESAVKILLPKTRIVVDSVDIHWVRDHRAKTQSLIDLSDEELAIRKDAEKRAYTNCDEVWVVSQADRSALAEELPWVKTRNVGIPFRYQPRQEAPHNSILKVLFVGGFSHTPNESAALWADEIVKEVRRRGYQIALTIAGANPPASVQALHRPTEETHVLGYVESLEPLYAEADLFIAPLRFGAGVKGKVLEAIERGVPVLTNAVGVEGLPISRDDGVALAESTDQFAHAIIQFIKETRSPSPCARADAAAAKLTKFFGADTTWKQIRALINPPPVTIAIVTFNRLDLLKRCLDSVITKTEYTTYRINIASNGCTDGTREFLLELQQIHGHRIEPVLLDNNEFFVRPSNRLIALSPSDDVVLMNNDVEVVNPGWLTNLVDAAYSAPDIGAAGGKILDPSGLISEAGAEIYASGRGRNLCRGAPGDFEIAQSFRDVGFVSGCLMYMRRDAIREVGALDEDFHPMYFEDAEWHYRAHTLGWRTIYTPWAVAIHNEGSSAGTDTMTGMKRYQEINRKKFLEKFRGIDFERYNG